MNRNRGRRVKMLGEGTKRTLLAELVHVRFRDGEVLLRSGEPERRIGAIYVAGYGIECALKARLCMERRVEKLPPEFKHHDLQSLARCTSAWRQLEDDRNWLARFTSLCEEWNVSMRYAKYPYEAPRVISFLQKAKEFIKWLSQN